MDDIFARPPPATAPPLPPASRTPAMIPAPPRSVPAAVVPATKPSPQPVRRSFRRNFLDRQDPFQTAGHQMPDFTFPGSYELNGAPGPQVVDEIHTRVVQRLVNGDLADAKVEVIDFDDAGMHGEPARRFVVASTDTRRGTMVTVNAFVQAYGDHLFFSVRSYLLPPLSIWKLLLSILITAAVYAVLDASLGVEPGPVPLIVTAIVAAVIFRKVIRNVLAGDPLLTALRKQFPQQLDWGTFNDDDVTAFLKTSLRLTLGSIASVLESHGIEVTGLKTIVQNIQTTNNYSASGTIVGAIFGGTGNNATGKVGP